MRRHSTILRRNTSPSAATEVPSPTLAFNTPTIERQRSASRSDVRLAPNCRHKSRSDGNRCPGCNSPVEISRIICLAISSLIEVLAIGRILGATNLGCNGCPPSLSGYGILVFRSARLSANYQLVSSQKPRLPSLSAKNEPVSFIPPEELVSRSNLQLRWKSSLKNRNTAYHPAQASCPPVCLGPLHLGANPIAFSSKAMRSNRLSAGSASSSSSTSALPPAPK